MGSGFVTPNLLSIPAEPVDRTDLDRNILSKVMIIRYPHNSYSSIPVVKQKRTNGNTFNITIHPFFYILMCSSAPQDTRFNTEKNFDVG